MKFSFQNDANWLKEKNARKKINENSIQSIKMSGYTFSSDTIFKPP